MEISENFEALPTKKHSRDLRMCKQEISAGYIDR